MFLFQTFTRCNSMLNFRTFFKQFFNSFNPKRVFCVIYVKEIYFLTLKNKKYGSNTFNKKGIFITCSRL